MESKFDVCDPATGQVIEQVVDGTIESAVRAVDAAAAAFPAWAATPARKRAEILRRCHELMLRDADTLTKLIATENGKSAADARAEVEYAAEFYRWFSEEAVRGEGSYYDAPAGGSKTIVTYVPVGVAALITPWNFPAAMAARKVAPA